MMKIRQAQILINQFRNLYINQQVQMEAPVGKYFIIPSKGNITPGDPQGLKLYIQATKEIYKEADKTDISVSNVEDIIDHFISLVKKYGWESLAFMVKNGVVAKNIFRQVDQLQIVDMHHPSHI